MEKSLTKEIILQKESLEESLKEAIRDFLMKCPVLCLLLKDSQGNSWGNLKSDIWRNSRKNPNNHLLNFLWNSSKISRKFFRTTNKSVKKSYSYLSKKSYTEENYWNSWKSLWVNNAETSRGFFAGFSGWISEAVLWIIPVDISKRIPGQVLREISQGVHEEYIQIAIRIIEIISQN